MKGVSVSSGRSSIAQIESRMKQSIDPYRFQLDQSGYHQQFLNIWPLVCFIHRPFSGDDENTLLNLVVPYLYRTSRPTKAILSLWVSHEIRKTPKQLHFHPALGKRQGQLVALVSSQETGAALQQGLAEDWGEANQQSSTKGGIDCLEILNKDHTTSKKLGCAEHNIFFNQMKSWTTRVSIFPVIKHGNET